MKYDKQRSESFIVGILCGLSLLAYTFAIIELHGFFLQFGAH